MRKIHLNFSGIYDLASSMMPASPGIYCVYRRKPGGRPAQLLYIGEALKTGDDFRNRGVKGEWNRFLDPKDEICSTFAPILSGRTRAHAAMVACHKPSGNAQSFAPFPFDRTEVLLSGKIPFLKFDVRIGSDEAQPGEEDFSELSLDEIISYLRMRARTLRAMEERVS